MAAFSAILTIVVLLGVAVFILLFERKRARQIERDLGSSGRGHHGTDGGRSDRSGGPER